jgi:hypothetical protein
MSVCVLIARFNEDIRWVRWLDTTRINKVIIVNKGANDVRMHHTFTPDKIMYLPGAPNVGREGQTFYQFIVDNYDNLPDHIVLLQGNPFDHAPHVVDKINKFLHEDVRSRPEFMFVSEELIQVDLDGEGHFTPMPLPMRAVWEHIFQEPSPEVRRWVFGAGAQMIVSKRTVLRRPRAVYERIVQILQRDADPIEGYVIERLHPVIFGI